MAGAKDFRELVCWKLAYELRLEALRLCKRPQVRQDFKLNTQLREAARSAPRNIAEGFGRWKHLDAARFARIAKASEVELINHFQEALTSGYISDKERQHCEHCARKALKVLMGWIRYLESTPDP